MAMTVPALVLLYSAIDIAAGLASEAPNAAGKQPFVKWVNRYMAVHDRLGCTALDLYGARCGLVHGFGSASTLSQSGKAKQILYAQGASDAAKLREIAAFSKIDYVVVHAANLLNTVRESVESFLDDAYSDSKLLERINRNALFAFENLSEARADELLHRSRQIGRLRQIKQMTIR